MHQETIQGVVEEIGPLLVGGYLGKIFQLSPLSYAIDIGVRDGRYLFISAEPSSPRLYLVKRRLKDLEKQSNPHSQFAQALRAKLSGAELISVTRDSSERVIRFTFAPKDEFGESQKRVLVAQLTGRSSNLFLLDGQGRITNVLRSAKGEGQSPGDTYESPTLRAHPATDETPLQASKEDSLSAALDSHYLDKDQQKAFQLRAKDLLGALRKELRQRAKLKENLEKDLVAHGEPEAHKRLGDLLLANIATAQRKGSKVHIQDFYTEGAPTIELDLDENSSLQEEASRYFARYTKAKRAKEEIAARLMRISRESYELQAKEALLERAIELHDEAALASFEKRAPQSKGRRIKRREVTKIPGVRLYKSSDGNEILVGRGARDNDNLTFRVAKPNDLWLHAADYPGSHVVVRRENRNEIPHRTIIEAAQLAARFSQASKDSKVVVHYTSRKFLSKPRGAAPGLVRMSTFKTILVEPKESVERIRI